MPSQFFATLERQTPTKLWINNPTQREAQLALSQGAVGCTTNPAFGGGLLKRAPDELRTLIESHLDKSPDDQTVMELVEHSLVVPVVQQFRSIHETSDGKAGFVSIQGAPERDGDGDGIFREAEDAQAIAPNATPKIPATRPGLQAFERAVAAGYPTIVTEVFSLDQLAESCEAYVRITARTGLLPPFFVSPITGIFGDHLRKVADQEGIACDPNVIGMAGVAFARTCYKVVEERAYPTTLLFGGARAVHDFTLLVGGNTATTLNYSTIEELIKANPPIKDTIHAPTDRAVDELTAKFRDFRCAVTPGSLAPGDFGDFGPVQHFRNSFIASRNSLLAAIREVRERHRGHRSTSTATAGCP